MNLSHLLVSLLCVWPLHTLGVHAGDPDTNTCTCTIRERYSHQVHCKNQTHCRPRKLTYSCPCPLFLLPYQLHNLPPPNYLPDVPLQARFSNKSHCSKNCLIWSQELNSDFPFLCVCNFEQTTGCLFMPPISMLG